MKLLDRVLDANRQAGHGPWREADGAWVDPKPYVSYWSNGIFEGYDGSLWMYFEAPDNVRTQWLSDTSEALSNQQFFITWCQDMAKLLSGETSAKKDVRREFHIQATQHPKGTIEPYEGCTPRHEDYLRRMSGQITRPSWRTFVGVQLIPSDIFHQAYGIKEKVHRWVEHFLNPRDVQYTLFARDLDDVCSAMERNGFKPLDFISDMDALERLTAWYGIPDDAHLRPIQLQTQRLQEPVHARSVITPRFGEMSFYALTPDEHVDVRDPLSMSSRWGEALYQPDADVSVVSIRGQIRSIAASENLLDIKNIKNERGDNGDSTYHNASIADLLSASMLHVRENQLPMIDNVEIIVGSVVPRREVAEHSVVRTMRSMGMRASVLVGRQSKAILSTLPTYPTHVHRVPKSNRKRPSMTNVMLPATLAFSGIFRANRPSSHGGVILGFGDVGHQYPEIFIDPDGASKANKSPTMLVVGRPGAGKSVQLTQMSSQMTYMGRPVVYLNPKSTGTLQPAFDYLGAQTVRMTMDYLADNPGLLDPVYFLKNRDDVASVLTDAIMSAMRMNEDRGTAGAQRRAALTAEIRERAMDPRNITSAHILFGRPDLADGLGAISDVEVLKFVSYKMSASPFWKALISVGHQSRLTQTLRETPTLLVEWGGGLELPNSADEITSDAHVDAVLSVNTIFRYSVERLEGTGGMLVIDESWALKTSNESVALLRRAGREWREANILLVLGTQRIRDWTDRNDADGDMTTFVSRFLFMALAQNDQTEMAEFLRLTGLEDTEEHRQFILNAGAEKAGGQGVQVARGYLVDTIHNWSGGLLCGPWPEAELNASRSDHAAKQARREAQAVAAATVTQSLPEEW